MKHCSSPALPRPPRTTWLLFSFTVLLAGSTDTEYDKARCVTKRVFRRKMEKTSKVSPQNAFPLAPLGRFPERHSSYLSGPHCHFSFLSLTPQNCGPSSALMAPHVARPHQCSLCCVPSPTVPLRATDGVTALLEA